MNSSANMPKLNIQVFTADFEVAFPRAVPFNKEKLDAIAIWLTDSVEGLCLRTEQVRLRTGDILFDYEISALFFGGNAAFRQNSERATLTMRAARTRDDASLIIGTASRFCNSIAGEAAAVAVSVNCHAGMGSAELRETFLRRFKVIDAAAASGTVAFFRPPEWPAEIRLLVEPSVLFSDGVFISVHMPVAPTTDWHLALTNSAEVFNKVARLLDFELTLPS